MTFPFCGIVPSSDKYYEMIETLIRTMRQDALFQSSKGKELYDYVLHHFHSSSAHYFHD